MADNAGWENVKGNSFADMGKEKQRQIASEGGKASGEARRRKRLMREQLDTLLSLDVKSPKARKQMEALGIDPDNMDNQMALLVAMLKEALNGNVRAFAAIRDTVGEMPVITQDVRVTENQKLADVIGQLGGKGLEEGD